MAPLKKVLIITYYWPPSGGSGVQRWLKFTKYLPSMGWKPIVITPENPSFINRDESLLREVHEETEVLKLPIWEPYSLSALLPGGGKKHQKDIKLTTSDSFKDKLLLWIRGNFLIPDPRVFWVNPVYRFLKDYISGAGIDHIITTGPPHSLHLIGLKLKRKLNVKWVADFRDPWSQWDLLDTFKLTSMARKRHKSLEDKVFKYADKIITVGNTMNEEFRKAGAQNPIVITNGFDPEDFQNMPKRSKNTKFTIRHIGTIDDLRDPRPFLKEFKNLINEGEEMALEFIGNTNPALNEYINEYDLENYVKLKTYLSHAEVIELFNSTDMLLLILANTHSSKLNITGKIFEYIASGCSVLGIGNEAGDAARILNSTGTGVVIDPSEGDSIRKNILKIKNGESGKIDKNEIDRYSRMELTRVLTKILNEL